MTGKNTSESRAKVVEKELEMVQKIEVPESSVFEDHPDLGDTSSEIQSMLKTEVQAPKESSNLVELDFSKAKIVEIEDDD
jgi:high-affinity K+ transport system ATPase subunit B